MRDVIFGFDLGDERSSDSDPRTSKWRRASMRSGSIRDLPLEVDSVAVRDCSLPLPRICRIERLSYARDCLTDTAKSETSFRKLRRGMRLYLLGPTVFCVMMLGSGSVIVSAVVALVVMSVSHAHLERTAPYVAGLEQSLSEYAEDFVKGNALSLVYTLTGVLMGYGPVSWLRDVAPAAVSLPEILGVGMASDSNPAVVLLLAIPVMLMADLFIYTYHRTAHHSGNSIQWRMHRTHHSIPIFLLSFGARAHPVETVVTYALCGLAGGILGVGLPATVSAGILMALIMSPHHINCDSELGILSKVFVTTEAHRWHHHIDYRDSGNFALLFSFWDRWLGTHHEPTRFSGRLGVEIGPEMGAGKDGADPVCDPFARASSDETTDLTR